MSLKGKKIKNPTTAAWRCVRLIRGATPSRCRRSIDGYDADARAVLDHLKSGPDCTGKLASVGICIGGHLAFRAAMNSDVLAAARFYATDIHERSLGKACTILPPLAIVEEIARRRI